jgi:tetratricopeptide (TPR) repeat protein
MAALLLPWLSYRYQGAAVAVWRHDLPTAYSRLDRAAELNPTATEPDLLAGTIALTVHDLPRARRHFQRVVEREPKNWYGYYQLAVTAAGMGNYPVAVRQIERAKQLNPADTILAQVEKVIRAHRPVNPARYTALYVKELNRRFSGNPHL